MKETNEEFVHNRRWFLSTAIPACAITCLGLKNVFAHVGSIGDVPQEQTAKHKFLMEYRKLSLSEYWRLKFKEYIDLVENLSMELSRERMLEFIKTHAYEEMLKYGKRQANGIEKGHFKSYIDNFRIPEVDKMLTMEIVEDNKNTFEIKVTECVFADTFLHFKAGDIGYAKICWGDYAWAKGYHPSIVLTRDKTLMEGHSCCNHRYTWVG